MRLLRSLAIPCFLLAACGSDSGTPRQADAGTNDVAQDDASDSLTNAGQDAASEEDEQDAASAEDEQEQLTVQAGSCGALSACEGYDHEVDAEGSTPWGKLVVQRIGIGTSSGFIVNNRLELVGTLDGQPASLRVSVHEAVTAILPAGTYSNRSEDSEYSVGVQLEWSSKENQCTRGSIDDPSVELRVDSYTTSDTESYARGAAIAFEGELTIEGAGWSLKLPLNLTTFCGDEFHI